MKTYKIKSVDELSKMNFILGKVEDLPSALKVELHKNALDDSDQILYRIYHNKYQVILPVDENELETSKVQSGICDINGGAFAIEDIDTTHGDIEVDKVATVLDAYSKKDAFATYSKVKLYSKVNPNLENWSECVKKFSEVLEGKDEESLSKEELDKLDEAFSSIPDVEILKDEIPAVEPEVEPTSVEPEVATEPEQVSTSSEESTLPIATPEVPVIQDEVTPQVDTTAVLDASKEVESQLDTSSTEPAPEEVPQDPTEPEAPKDEPKEEIDLNKFMERLSKFEEKLDFVLKRLGINPEEVNSLVSYGQKMKALAKMDMGGELL